MKNYGLSKLYLKARDRLERDRLEKNYQEFLFAGRPVESELQLQREHRFSYEPLISIVVPVYRTPEAFLREMVESVLGQTYASLELCLADGSGDDDHTERILKAYAEKDPRVRYEKLPENLGIMWHFWIMMIFWKNMPCLRSYVFFRTIGMRICFIQMKIR